VPWHPRHRDDLGAATKLDLMDQGVQQPPAGRGRPGGDRDPDLCGQVGELPACGRLDVDAVQGGARLVLADAQLRDPAAEPLDALTGVL
jgi:hypothetical protein